MKKHQPQKLRGAFFREVRRKGQEKGREIWTPCEHSHLLLISSPRGPFLILHLQPHPGNSISEIINQKLLQMKCHDVEKGIT